LSQGRPVTVFDTFWFGDHLGEHAALTKVTGDVRDTAALRTAMAGADAVVLLACLSNDPMADIDPTLTRAVNLEALQRAIAAAHALGVRRVVFASSTSVFGIQDVPRVVESTPHKPITLYSKYKSEIEAYLLGQLAPGFEGVVVRGATVCGYSPRMRLDLLVNIFCWLALTKGVITIEGGSQIRPLVHIQDVVDFYAKMVDADARLVNGEAFHVSAGNFTVQQIADMVQEYTGCELTYTGVTDPRSYPADAEKAATVLGYRPTRTVRDAMVEVCEAIKDGRVRGDTVNYNIRWYREFLGVK
jgi:nucleoside-diphosphate-sugar epimerase